MHEIPPTTITPQCHWPFSMQSIAWEVGLALDWCGMGATLAPPAGRMALPYRRGFRSSTSPHPLPGEGGALLMRHRKKEGWVGGWMD